MKRRFPASLFLILLLAFLMTSSVFFGCGKRSDDLELIAKKNSIEKEGRRLEKQGSFNEALQKYREAMALDKEIYGAVEGRPMAFVSEVLQKKGDLQESLVYLNQLSAFHPKHDRYDDREREIEVLLEFSKTGDRSFVDNYISWFQNKYALRLPPNTYLSASLTPISTILRLYDTIGDYDAGIAYIDEILEYGYSQNKNYVRVKSSQEALQRGYKTAAEYLKVREAFEREKVNGGPTCGEWGSKDEFGRYCVGDATQALIESDYFPW